MNLEQVIQETIEKKLQEGIIEKAIGESIEKAVNAVFENMCGYGGEIRKTIKEKVESVMIPYLENHDYSEYILKLDTVLSDVLTRVTSDNRKILTNFATLMPVAKLENVSVEDIFEKWKEYVADHLERDNLEVCFDDEYSYYPVEVTCRLEDDTIRNWSSFKYKKIVMECEAQKDLNVTLELSRFGNKENWNVRGIGEVTYQSLRLLNSFEVFVLSLQQAYTPIEIEDEYQEIEGEVDPKLEPECTVE